MSTTLQRRVRQWTLLPRYLYFFLHTPPKGQTITPHVLDFSSSTVRRVFLGEPLGIPFVAAERCLS